MAGSVELVKLLLIGVCSNYPRDNTSVTTNEDGSLVPAEQVCVLREPKLLSGQTLKIATLQDSLTRVTRDQDDNVVGQGIAFKFVHILQQKFGFRYKIVVPTENVMGDAESGVVGLLKSGEADMAATFLPIFTEYTSMIQYSVALSESEWVVLMKRPRDSATGKGLLAPFDATVWLLILVSLILVGPVIYLIILIRVRLCRGSERLTRIYPVDSCIWFVYGALMKQGSVLNPISDSSRLLFATWWIFITILTAFYTANLTAFLTLSRFTLPIQGAKDLVQGSYRWVAHRGGAIQHIITKHEEFSFLNQTVNQNLGQFLDVSDEEILVTVAKSDVKFLREKRSIDHLVFRDYLNKTKANMEEGKKCTFVVTPKSFLFHSVGFAFPFNSTLAGLFNPVLSSLVESGIVKHHLREGLPESQICPLDLGSNERKLQNADLQMTYMVVVAGFVVAATVFLGEVAYRHWRLCLGSRKTSSPEDGVWTTDRSHPVIPSFSRKIADSRGKDLDHHGFGRGLDHHGFGRGLVLGQGQGKVQGLQRKKINGRDYVLVTAQDGRSKLVPVQPPSAFLFQYAA